MTIVDGLEDTYSSDSPVSVTPLVSFTVAVRGCVLFRLTVTGLLCPTDPPDVRVGAVSEIEAGGHVEKKPAELAAFATFAEIRVDPGWLAVATPF